MFPNQEGRNINNVRHYLDFNLLMSFKTTRSDQRSGVYREGDHNPKNPILVKT